MIKTQLFLRWIVVLLLWTASISLNAQSATSFRITAQFDQQSLVEVLNAIQQNHPIRFYYKPEELPQPLYTLEFRAASLEQVMQQLLQGTRLGYLVYRDYAIVIVPKAVVDEIYTAGYYQALEQSRTVETPAEKPDQKRPILVGDISRLKPSGAATVSGLIQSREDGEPIAGALVQVLALDKGAATDENGRFELELPAGKHLLQVQYIGNANLQQEIQVLGSGTLTLSMERDAVKLSEVVVTAQAPDANVQQVQIGVTRLDVKKISKLPSFLGEADVVKSLLLSPGVSSIGEGATGFNVRGGEVDQNLVLQDDGMLFNASHALGFFSTFHPDLINSVTLYKSIIPAQYGGRLASVLDVKMRDGNFDAWRVKGGISPVSGRIAAEGPIVPKKSAIIIGARSSYSDWILRSLRNLELRNSSVFFYDATARYTQRLNEKNILTLSGYVSSDKFDYNGSFGFEYRTTMGQALYKKIFSERLISQLSATASRYESVQSDYTGLDASRLDQQITHFQVKEQVTYSMRKNVQLNTGFSAIYYLTAPGEQQPLGNTSRVFPKMLERERGVENALFLNADWTASPRLQLSGGLRLGLYLFLGPKTVFEYDNPDMPDAREIAGSVSYGKGKVIATYGSLEPRFSARYAFTPTTSVKAGYSRTAQFINQIFNTDSPTPTSQFQLSTRYIKPSRSHNVSAGLFQNFKENAWETSLEIYGRIIDQLFDYRDFAELTVNERLETELLNGRGRAYGAELSIRKNTGVLNGLLSYALSRTERQTPGINNGAWYLSNFDKPHDLSLLLNYQYNQRHTLTLNFKYGTGRPVTAPITGYPTIEGIRVPIYTDRNALRIPDYHRLDLAYTYGKGPRKDRRFKTSWTFSLYNAYGRKNPFSVFFTQTPSTSAQANRLAVLGSIFPAVTFNFETL